MDNLFNFLFPDYETQETNDIDSIVERESNRYGLDSGIVKALVKQESGGKTDAISPKGAIGVMQIMPETGKAIAKQLGEEFSIEKLKDPETNIKYGTYLLAQNKQNYGGRDDLALAAYHGGSNAVLPDGTINPNIDDGIIKTVDYVKSILGQSEQSFDQKNRAQDSSKSASYGYGDFDELSKFLGIKLLPDEGVAGSGVIQQPEIVQPTIPETSQEPTTEIEQPLVPDIQTELPSSTQTDVGAIQEPKSTNLGDLFAGGSKPLPQEEPAKRAGFGEALIRSVGKGTAELGLSIARTPQTAIEAYIGLNNLFNKGVNKGLEAITGGKVKDLIPMVSPESIPDFIKLNEEDWDVKAIKEFIKNQDEAINQATNSKGIIDNLKEGNFTEAGKVLGVQVAAQIPLVVSMAFGGFAGMGAKALGGMAGITTASQKMDQYWDNVEQGLTEQSFEQATVNATVNGFIEGIGESLGTGKILSDAIGILTKGGKKEIAKKLIGNTVGKYVGKVLQSAGIEGTEETIVGYSQAVSDKIFGERPDLTFMDAIKEGIESGLVGAFTSAATTGQLAGIAEMTKETQPEAVEIPKPESFEVVEPATPVEEIQQKKQEQARKLEKVQREEQKKQKIDVEAGIESEIKELQAIKRDYLAKSLPQTKKAFQQYWEERTGEKISREEAKEKLNQVMGSIVEEADLKPAEKPKEKEQDLPDITNDVFPERKPEIEQKKTEPIIEDVQPPKKTIKKKSETKGEDEQELIQRVSEEQKEKIVEKPEIIKKELSQEVETKKIKNEPKKTMKVKGQEVDVNPTEAQKEAGNYKKAHIQRNGMEISIENPSGSIRSGTDSDGETWSQEMKADYGYIKGTIGKDKDHIDVFIKPGSKENDKVFVVNQVNPKTGKFDEHKIMMGYDTKEEALKAYNSNYEKGWKGAGSIVEMSMDRFKEWSVSKEPQKGTLEEIKAPQADIESIQQKLKPRVLSNYKKSVTNAIEKKDDKAINYLSSVILRKTNTNIRKLFESEYNVKLPETTNDIKQVVTGLISKQNTDSEYQPRFLLYASEQGKSPEEVEVGSKYINWVNEKWSEYDKEKNITKNNVRDKAMHKDFDAWLQQKTQQKIIDKKPDIEPKKELKPKTQYSEVPTNIKNETSSQQQVSDIISAAHDLNKTKNRSEKIKAVKNIGDQIQHNPGGNKKGSGYLNPLEYTYFKVKEIAEPILKMRRVLEKEGKATPETIDMVDNAIDRARGAMATAQQYLEDNYYPIFEKIKGSSKEKGIIARNLSKYLVSKRTEWLYQNKKNYEDDGISEKKAREFVDIIENGELKNSDIILQMAHDIWNYNKGLIKYKYDAGVIDKDLLDNLKEPYYVPFYRDIEEGRKGAPISQGKLKFTTISTGIKRIKGSKTGLKIIDPIQLMVTSTHETIVNAARVEVAQNVVKLAKEHEDIFGDLITKLPPKWMRASDIEQRVEIDTILKPKLDELAQELGIDVKRKAKLGKNKMGLFNEYDQEIRLLYGATEGSYAHELGHALDAKYPWIGQLFSDKKYKEELWRIADSRYEGMEVPTKFVRYVRQRDEKIAEFVSLYLTNRPMLKNIAPMILKDFEQKIKKDPGLKKLIDMKPTNVQGIESYPQENWVLDNSIPKDEDVISLREEGKLVHYRVPLEMAQAIKNLHPAQLPTWMKYVFLPTRTLRFGAVVGNIEFPVANIPRDQLDAAFNTKTIPFVDWFIGAKLYLTKPELFKMYNRRGGGMDSPESGISGGKASYADIVYGSKTGEFLDPFYWKSRGVLKGTKDLAVYGIKFPFKPVMFLAELSEQATRLGVFRRNLLSNKGIDINNLESEDARIAINNAVHAARQSTLDFQRYGYSGRIPNEVIPFLNAALEGLDRTARSVVVPISKGKLPTRQLMYIGLVYGVYAGLTAWNRKEEEDYKKINSQEKANNWVIMKGEGDGTYWKIPKGHITKLVLNPAQMTWEAINGLTQKDGWGLAIDMFTDISPINEGNMLPVIAKLIIEPIAGPGGYDFYWHEEIEKPYIRTLPEKYRYKRSTSETLKTIGKALNISPIMMQHEINTALGGMGRNMLWVTDWILGVAGVQQPPHFNDDRTIILRRFNGKVEDWKTDASSAIKHLNAREREIKMGGRKKTIEIMRKQGASKKEIMNMIKDSDEELKKIAKKRRELENAMRIIDKKIKPAFKGISF